MIALSKSHAGTQLTGSEANTWPHGGLSTRINVLFLEAWSRSPLAGHTEVTLLASCQSQRLQLSLRQIYRLGSKPPPERPPLMQWTT